MSMATIDNKGGIKPEGTLSITTNGTHDVTEYAEADVQVPNSNTETYTASSSSSALDMGATNNYRYVNTSALTKVSGTKSITANGNNQDVKTYEKVNVSVPASAVCSGTKSITSNGSHTVTGYKTASVSVPTGGSGTVTVYGKVYRIQVTVRGSLVADQTYSNTGAESLNFSF